MLNNNRGFTLVEMLVAMVVILIAILGLVQTALLSIDTNVKNLLRDEAVRIAEERMNQLKSRPVDDAGLPPAVNCDATAVVRNVRNIAENYQVCTTIINLNGSDQKSLQVIVGWNYKNELPHSGATNTEFQHSISSIVMKTT
jgi:type IV pilus assembly protein PilV